MRFSALLPIAALAAVAAAAPNALETRDNSTSQCNTGSNQCCTQTYTSTDTGLASLLGVLGVVLPNISGLVGVGCTPITVIGTGAGASCTQQAVCCTNNTFSGLINVGCTPININL